MTTATATFTAREVEAALWLHFAGSSWAALPEVTIDPDVPYGHPDWGKNAARRIDMLMVRRSRNPERHGAVDRLAIEIKVARSDFLADIKRPEKQQPWREFAHRHAYAVPDGLIDKSEVPDGSGLLVVRRRDWGPPAVEWAKKVPYQDRPADLPSWLVLGLAWRLSSAEMRLRGYTRSDAEDPEQLRATVDRLTAENAKLDRQIDRAREDVKAWRTAAVKQGLPCSTCRELLKPKSVRHGSYTGWVHVSSSDEATCKLMRETAAVANAKVGFEQLTAERQAELVARYGDEPWNRHGLYVRDATPIDTDEDLLLTRGATT